MPGMRNGINEEEAYNKYGDDVGKVEIGAIGKHGDFKRARFFGIPDGSLVGVDLRTTWAIGRFRPVAKRPELMLLKIENYALDFA